MRIPAFTQKGGDAAGVLRGLFPGVAPRAIYSLSLSGSGDILTNLTGLFPDVARLAIQGFGLSGSGKY